MSLEAFTGWIKDLIATNPAGGDPKSQGDDHIRGIKQTLVAQFAGLTQGKAVTVNEDQLNSIPAVAARGLACLPKDGSEPMTGLLNGVGVHTKDAGGYGVATEAPSSNALLRLKVGDGDGGLLWYKADGAIVDWLVNVLSNAGRVPTDVVFSLNVPHTLVRVVPFTSNGQEVVTSKFVRDTASHVPGASLGGNVTLNATPQLVAETALQQLAGGSFLAMGCAEVVNPGAAITLYMRLDLVNSGGGVVKSYQTRTSIQAGFAETVTPATFGFVPAGNSMRVRFFLWNTGAATVDAGMAQAIAVMT